MAVDVKDRVPTKPNRRKITFDDGTVVYADIEYADEPTEQGTPINRELFQKVAADVPSFKNLGDLGGFGDQASLNSILDNLIPSNYGNAVNLVCTLGIHFQSSEPYGWAAGCTLLATGGSGYGSQVLTGCTGIFHRQRLNGVWEAWSAINRGTVLWEGSVNTGDITNNLTISSFQEYKFIEVFYSTVEDRDVHRVDRFKADEKNPYFSSYFIRLGYADFDRSNQLVSAYKCTIRVDKTKTEIGTNCSVHFPVISSTNTPSVETGEIYVKKIVGYK